VQAPVGKQLEDTPLSCAHEWQLDEPFNFEQRILPRIAGGLKLDFHASFTQTLQKTSGSALLSK
jgi:hypothetical protein